MTVELVQWLFLGYFVALGGSYLLLQLVAFRNVSTALARTSVDPVLRLVSGLEPPVSVLVPAHNEARTIRTTVASLLQLDYPEFEVIVVNDGSSDPTLDVLKQTFDLEPTPPMLRPDLVTRHIRAAYRSRRHPNLVVLDKENGGKADALNAGINAARFPLFCGVDADSILQRDSLTRVVQPFLDDPHTIAAGGTIRIANGCEVRQGFLVRIGLPRSFLALCQVVEYLRAFLFGRMGWESSNALLIISGAFGVFHRDTVVSAGGYRNDTVGEDMELVVRLHRQLRAARRPYRITFVPDPICWTEAPEHLHPLQNQRARWHRGLVESLWLNRQLLFARRGGAAGWLAFPFMVLFEGLSPIVELLGYVFFALSWWAGAISAPAAAAFLFVALSLGVMLSVTAVLLEELSFHVYPQRRQLLMLLLIAVVENVGYRQLVAFYRLRGLLQWLTRREPTWGRIPRKAAWLKH